jgi:TIR domain-containing protein
MRRAQLSSLCETVSNPMLDLFVTYGHRSEDDVRGLLEDLTALGDTVWCEAQQHGGQHGGLAWWEQTLSRIRSCDALLFALAPRTLESEACWREMRYAHALGKPVVAIELSDLADLGAIPAPLGSVPFVNYRKRDHHSALQLCRVLRRLGKAAALPAVLPTPPGVPPSNLAGLRELITSRGKLDASQQSRLLAELARDSREVHSAFEARQLLQALRQRRDLSASSIGEIDTLLRKTAATQMKLRAPLGPPPSTSAWSAHRQSMLPPARPEPAFAYQRAHPRDERRVQPAPRRLTARRVAISLGALVSCTAAGCLIASNAHQDSAGADTLQMGPIEVPGVELVALLVLGAGIVGVFARLSLARALLAAVACLAAVAAWLAVVGSTDAAFVSSFIAAPTGLMLGTGLAATWQVAARRVRSG